MKTSICLAAWLLALNLSPALGQPAPPPGGNFQQRLQAIVERSDPSGNQPPALTKFNLDFPGGTPAELVKAIQKATGKPLNAIIPTEDANTELPPLRMNDVTAPQLFDALKAASIKTVAVQGGTFSGSYSQFVISYGFKTSDSPISDTSIWYFHADKPSMPPVVSTAKYCRFFSLAPYLDRGFTVDDITTAVQTGWKMAGVTPPPQLNYHKETKLLIAFGAPDDLNVIQSVLSSLPYSNATEDELKHMNSQITQLTDQITQLKKKIPPPQPLSGSTDEKTGK